MQAFFHFFVEIFIFFGSFWVILDKDGLNLFSHRLNGWDRFFVSQKLPTMIPKNIIIGHIHVHSSFESKASRNSHSIDNSSAHHY